MNRTDLIIKLRSCFPAWTRTDVTAVVASVLGAMTDALASGKRIEIRGFGSFSLTYRPPRKGRNPKSGETVSVPGKYLPHFKPGKVLREGVDRP